MSADILYSPTSPPWNPMSRTQRQTLIFDADDTLWENNFLFERVINDYLDWLAHPTLDRMALRDILDDIEQADVAVHGYGSAVFLQSLHRCLEHLRERPATAVEKAEINELATALIHHEVELMPEVATVLGDLGERHDLLLLTKGALDEQQRKVDASGLAHHFRDIHIVKEKNAETYHWLAGNHALTLESSWMIGNSPKSDILPARQAGLNAVFIPNQHTWVLDHAELDPSDQQILHVTALPDLLKHF